MNARRNLLLLATLAAVAGPASGQQAAPATGEAEIAAESSASIPDFSGIWRQGSLPWFVPPASGPGPVTNRSRRPDSGQSDYGQLVGDYTNPILQPWAAEVVKKKGELSLAGVTFPSPANQCWPEPVPSGRLHDALDCDHNLFARSPGMAGDRLCRKPARIPSRHGCGRPPCGQAGFLSVE